MKRAEEISVTIERECDEATHAKTVDSFGRMLATFAAEVQAWCDAHPGAVEQEEKRLQARRSA